ncbi:putative serine protease K12H4.7 [Diplodia seriata]|uniref:Putative serine protease K12H4.7 n=1 Tax=Diplodia seriata TaxID=420778 RepID=A0A1S8BFW8_9PEZI|nr:putative serine protease K12H4.7 [Diplodia seriata]
MFLNLLVGLLCLSSQARALRTSLPIRELRKQVCCSAAPRPTSPLLTASQIRALHEPAQFDRRDVDPSALYPAYNISVPIDHFHNDSLYAPHTNGTFPLRYWFDATYYQPGGPVIVLASGETSGEDRFPYLQKGIVAQLANATGGLGVILEHRYYGESWPVSDLTTESLRFLTTAQALKDTQYFAEHVVFEGLEGYDLGPSSTPWIAYGGSYAGAFVAFLRKLYPETFWGAISSSGVTEAIYDYWQYYEAQRLYGPPDCISTLQKLTHVVDNILTDQNNTKHKNQLKSAFGLGNLTYDDDFANVLSYGIAGWQSLNWDPAVSDPSVFEYCSNLTSDSPLYPDTATLQPDVEELLRVGGYADEVLSLSNRMLNYIGYVNLTQVSQCSETQDGCFSNHNATFYAQDDISQTWRAWPYQYCTQWGYLQTGSGVPSSQLPLISRLIDVDYNAIICRDAFNITTAADVEAINKYGGYGISYPRLAIIDGEADPWRAATPHAFAAPNRTSTDSEPFILITGKAVHHWDENGLFPNETTTELPPAPVADAQAREAQFVKTWVSEFVQRRGGVEGMSKRNP